MPMATEDTKKSSLLASREPVGPVTPGSKGTPGDQAVTDAVIIVLLAWAVLFALMWSLRTHNI